MDSILSRISSAYAENPAKALALIPELIEAWETGEIIELPCKVGDTVRAMVNRPYNGHDVTIFGTVTDAQAVIRVTHSGCRHIDFIAPDFGKTVFLTPEAAQKALEGMKNGK